MRRWESGKCIIKGMRFEKRGELFIWLSLFFIDSSRHKRLYILLWKDVKTIMYFVR